MKSASRILPIALLATASSCRAPDASPLPPTSPPPASPTATEADARELSVRLPVLISSDAPMRSGSVEDAEARLSSTNYFATAAGSLGGDTPLHVIAFNTILDSPRAAESIERLVAATNPATRLYGICGLWFVAPERYEAELEKLRALPGDLLVWDGCCIMQIPFETVVEMVRKRSLPRKLRS